MYLKAFFVWILMALGEMIHGILRNRFLTPFLGDKRARQLSVLTGSCIIFVISYYSISWIHPTQGSEAIYVGILRFICMMNFEFLLGHFVLKFSRKWLINDFNIFQGKLLLLGMIFLAAAPWLTARIRGLI